MKTPIRKRKWSAEEPISSAELDLTSLRNSSRLRRHAQAYAEHVDPGSVLDRYGNKAVALDRKTLLRCICHVGAWVALLPPEIGNEVKGVNGKSPVLLLAQLLRMRGRGKLTPWLRGVLRLVEQKEHEAVPTEPHARAQWAELHSSMPGTTTQEQQLSDQSESECAHKRAQLFNNELALWSNCETSQRNRRIELLKAKVSNMMESDTGDLLKLRRTLRQVVAALSAPRALPERDSGVRLDEVSEAQLQRSAAEQKTVRHMLHRLINHWRVTLWLEDEQIQPMLRYVKDLITSFEESHGDIRQHACAGKQWALLKAAVVTDTSPIDMVGCVPSLLSSVSETERALVGSEEGTRRTYTKRTNKASEAGVIGNAVRRAFACVGRNTLTGAEIVSAIQRESSIWRDVSEKLNRARNEHLTRKQSEVWMANLRGNLGRFCSKTSHKKDGKWLWRLKCCPQASDS